MTKGKCNECLFWKDGICDKKGKNTTRAYSCNEWISRSNKQEKEKIQLADSYVPNIWDEWKKTMLKKQGDQKSNWEF